MKHSWAVVKRSPIDNMLLAVYGPYTDIKEAWAKEVACQAEDMRKNRFPKPFYDTVPMGK